MAYRRLKIILRVMALSMLLSINVFAEEGSDIIPLENNNAFYEESMDQSESVFDEIVPESVEVVESEEFIEEDFYINSLFMRSFSVRDLSSVEESYGIESASNESCTSWDEVVQIVRSEMVKRNTIVTIDYESAEPLATGWLKQLISDVMVETASSVEGDYLKCHFAGCKSSRKTSNSGGRYYNHLVLTFTYYTSSEQENAVTEQVQSLLNSFNFSSTSSVYSKIKIIYDWLCANVSYDYTNLKDDSYKLKYSAYAAIINRTAVCQGYTSLAYRLLRESGVNARIITGTSSGERHAWLIAEIDGLYYNMDPTWDEGKTTHKYFLKGKNNFTNHSRAAEFDTDIFYQIYPMANEDYVYSEKVEDNKNHTGSNQNGTLVNGNAKAMYRLYNPYTSEHFYTSNSYERDYLAEVGWHDEGIAWYAPLTGNPVYRLYNPYVSDHHYTLSSYERDHLVSVGWSDEGIGWYSDANQSVKVYRLYNPYTITGMHHYTMSSGEVRYLSSIGWHDEGIGWYGVNP